MLAEHSAPHIRHYVVYNDQARRNQKPKQTVENVTDYHTGTHAEYQDDDMNVRKVTELITIVTLLKGFDEQKKTAYVKNYAYEIVIVKNIIDHCAFREVSELRLNKGYEEEVCSCNEEAPGKMGMVRYVRTVSLEFGQFQQFVVYAENYK